MTIRMMIRMIRVMIRVMIRMMIRVMITIAHVTTVTMMDHDDQECEELNKIFIFFESKNPVIEMHSANRQHSLWSLI